MLLGTMILYILRVPRLSLTPKTSNIHCQVSGWSLFGGATVPTESRQACCNGLGFRVHLSSILFVDIMVSNIE